MRVRIRLGHTVHIIILPKSNQKWQLYPVLLFSIAQVNISLNSYQILNMTIDYDLRVQQGAKIKAV